MQASKGDAGVYGGHRKVHLWARYVPQVAVQHSLNNGIEMMKTDVMERTRIEIKEILHFGSHYPLLSFFSSISL